MKTNKYTYVIKYDDENHVIFNGITKDFMIIANKKVFSYKAILDNPQCYEKTHPRVILQLKKFGMLIDDEEYPKDVLIEQRENFINSKEYKTIILPTFECNYSCWYCVQKHVTVKLDYRKFDLIIKHIKKYIKENGIQHYILSWFGGEPLTQPEVISYISSRLLSFCKENDVSYSSGITTNGALMTEEVIAMLQTNRVNYYQITLDGDEVAHNKIKFDDRNSSSFALILGNICNLLALNEEAEVTLRLNYTLPMLKSRNLMSDIIRYIPWNLRKRITVDLQRVWQLEESTIPYDRLFALQEELVNNGFSLTTSHIFNICYVEKTHYNMFFYNGGVEKCDKQPIDKLRGYLNEDGDIVWKEKPIFHDYGLFSEDCVCNECKYYPLCYNGCPMERETRIKENGKVVCGHNGNPDLLELRIRDYCRRVINNSKLKVYEEN